MLIKFLSRRVILMKTFFESAASVDCEIISIHKQINMRSCVYLEMQYMSTHITSAEQNV